jgi:hypothetical protein
VAALLHAAPAPPWLLQLACRGFACLPVPEGDWRALLPLRQALAGRLLRQADQHHACSSNDSWRSSPLLQSSQQQLFAAPAWAARSGQYSGGFDYAEAAPPQPVLLPAHELNINDGGLHVLLAAPPAAAPPNSNAGAFVMRDWFSPGQHLPSFELVAVATHSATAAGDAGTATMAGGQQLLQDLLTEACSSSSGGSMQATAARVQAVLPQLPPTLAQWAAAAVHIVAVATDDNNASAVTGKCGELQAAAAAAAACTAARQYSAALRAMLLPGEPLPPAACEGEGEGELEGEEEGHQAVCTASAEVEACLSHSFQRLRW